jgi:histidinol-phosphate phosphatase family protein
MNRFIFFDRDGTLIEHVHHLSNLNDVKLVKLLGQTLKAVTSLGFKLGIVTNQSVISRGMATAELVERINNAILSAVYNSHGVKFEFLAYCPHMPDQGCECRKPKIGLVQTFLETNAIDVARSYMVGDQMSDVEFGKNAGFLTILISGTHNYNQVLTSPDYVIEQLADLPALLQSIELRNN